jgi:bifunctional DNA-binding transcriptional regulator/antitoxin component of YhaV-PrlF toxin-antitoxin module
MEGKEHSASIDKNARILIPPRFRRELGLEPGDSVSLRLEQGEVRIATLRRRLAKAQRIVRKHVPRSVSLVDELIAERRE